MSKSTIELDLLCVFLSTKIWFPFCRDKIRKNMTKFTFWGKIIFYIYIFHQLIVRPQILLYTHPGLKIRKNLHFQQYPLSVNQINRLVVSNTIAKFSHKFNNDYTLVECMVVMSIVLDQIQNYPKQQLYMIKATIQLTTMNSSKLLALA